MKEEGEKRTLTWGSHLPAAQVSPKPRRVGCPRRAGSTEGPGGLAAREKKKEKEGPAWKRKRAAEKKRKEKEMKEPLKIMTIIFKSPLQPLWSLKNGYTIFAIREIPPNFKQCQNSQKKAFGEF